jgi:hypothetical protein
MDQRSICPFPDRKRLSARDIHNELVAILGLDAMAYSAITKYLRQQHFPAISSEPAVEPPITIIGDAIRDALNKQPFSSIHEFAKF